jgi:hypothetical protein
MPDETTIVISFHLFIIVEICLAVGVGAQAQGVLIQLHNQHIVATEGELQFSFYKFSLLKTCLIFWMF